MGYMNDIEVLCVGIIHTHSHPGLAITLDMAGQHWDNQTLVAQGKFLKVFLKNTCGLVGFFTRCREKERKGNWD